MTTQNVDASISPFAVHALGYFAFAGVRVDPTWNESDGKWDFGPIGLPTKEGPRTVNGSVSLWQGTPPTFQADVSVGASRAPINFGGEMFLPYASKSKKSLQNDISSGATLTNSSQIKCESPQPFLDKCTLAKAYFAWQLGPGLLAATGIVPLVLSGDAQAGWWCLIQEYPGVMKVINGTWETIQKKPTEAVAIGIAALAAVYKAGLGAAIVKWGFNFVVGWLATEAVAWVASLSSQSAEKYSKLGASLALWKIGMYQAANGVMKDCYAQ
jgi:hypothetical protein